MRCTSYNPRLVGLLFNSATIIDDTAFDSNAKLKLFPHDRLHSPRSLLFGGRPSYAPHGQLYELTSFG
jgi:hypothetical protein